MTRRATELLLLIALVTSLVTSLGCLPQPAAGPLQIGERIPDFTLEQLSGGHLSSQDLLGDEPVVINFWATWCGPCRREIPTLKELHRQRGARVVSIALDHEGAEVVGPFVDENGIDYPVLLGDSDFLQSYGANSIPFTLVLDGELRLVKSFKGLVSDRTLEKGVAAARSSLGASS